MVEQSFDSCVLMAEMVKRIQKLVKANFLLEDRLNDQRAETQRQLKFLIISFAVHL